MRIILFFILSFISLCFITATAYAGWVDDDIDSILDNVDDIKTNVSTVKTNVGNIQTKVTGNISTVADEFKKQVDILQDKGLLLKDTAEQLLEWLNSHRDEYIEFAGDNCDNNSPCGLFREEIRVFIQEFSYLSDKYPVIEKMGMSDSPRIIKLIDRLPPILIFPMHEAMSRMPDWQEIPEQLSAIFDEIGDPEVFSVDFDLGINASTSGYTRTSLNILTPTETFCERNADRLDNVIDPVRLNRIKLFVSYIKTGMSIIGEIPPKDQSVDIVGEGGSLPIPNAFKMIVHLINFIQDAVSTYRDNINICIEINELERSRQLTLEIQLASCLQLVDFIMPGTRDAVYFLVSDKIDEARTAGISVRQSERSMTLVDSFRADRDWKEAYLKLCDAYKKIGK